MTESPAVRIPLDPKEQPILDKLLAIRTDLELLKQDRSTYVKSQDIIEKYDSVIVQVEALNQIRTSKRLEQNRGAFPKLQRAYNLADISDTHSRYSFGRLLSAHFACLYDCG